MRGYVTFALPKRTSGEKEERRKELRIGVLKKSSKNIWRFKIKSRPLQPETESEGIISEENFVK